MTVKDEIWKFSLANPDYWELLRSDDEPPEVAELEASDKQAFGAARREVQRRLVGMMQACVDELACRSQRSAIVGAIDRSPQDRSILRNRVRVALPQNKGWLWLTTHGIDGRVQLYASVWVAKKRYSEARQALVHATERDGSLHYALPVEATDSDAVTAAKFVDRFFPDLLRWLTHTSGAGAEPHGPSEEMP
jgi:hypothetical protein